MSKTTDVQLEIWFEGREEKQLCRLTAEDAARFEVEYAAWMTSGLPAGEFQYTDGGKSVFIRFDPIAMRKTGPVPVQGVPISAGRR